jgi:hypothetical protein
VQVLEDKIKAATEAVVVVAEAVNREAPAV